MLLAGGALGANRGAASLALYAVIGGFLPVFAPVFKAVEGELVHFIFPWEGINGWAWNLPTGGYIVGFIGAAWIVGRLVERDESGGRWRVPIAMLAGNAVLYIPGLLRLRYEYDDWATTLATGLWPFVLGDLVKLCVAWLTLSGAWWVLVGRKGQGG